MIKFYDQVPVVYSNASRDFQYLGWLFNIVLNSVKHNVDSLYDLPNSKTDAKLTELLALTLGFKIKRNYDQNQLRALTATLPKILKYKGTKEAVDMAGLAILAASGATGDFKSTINNGELEVIFPVNLVDVSLFTDLLQYILPAGMTYHIIRKNEIALPSDDSTTKLRHKDILIAALVPELDWDTENHNTTGLANIYDVGTKEPIFSNFIKQTEKEQGTEQELTSFNPNIGLLDNSIIPALTKPVELPITKETKFSEEPNEYGTTIIVDEHSEKANASGNTIKIEGE